MSAVEALARNEPYLPQDRAALIEAAERIAADLTATGAERDRAGAAPFAEVEALRRSGLLAALHDTSIGGGGLDWVDAQKLVRIVSRGDTSIGQLLGYHYVNSQVPYLTGSNRADALGRETVARGLYWGAAVNPRDPPLTVTRTARGFVVNGRKTFSTGTRIADRINVVAPFEGKLIHIIAPTDRPGLIVNDDWDNIGQRLTESGSVDFRDYAFTDADFLVPPSPLDAVPSAYATLNTPLIQLVFVNFYLGTAEAALAAALDYVRTTTKPWENSGVARAADDPYILERIGEFSASLRASTALADAAAASLQTAIYRGPSLTSDERGAVAIDVYHAKVHATHVSLDLTNRFFEIMGARATASRYGFDRFWRNVRTHTLHDPVYYKARDVGDFLINGKIPQPDLYR